MPFLQRLSAHHLCRYRRRYCRGEDRVRPNEKVVGDDDCGGKLKGIEEGDGFCLIRSLVGGFGAFVSASGARKGDSDPFWLKLPAHMAAARMSSLRKVSELEIGILRQKETLTI